MIKWLKKLPYIFHPTDTIVKDGDGNFIFKIKGRWFSRTVRAEDIELPDEINIVRIKPKI